MGAGERQLSVNLLDHMTEAHEINPAWEEKTLLGDSKESLGSADALSNRLESGSREIAVRCPLCGQELMSGDDESLSEELSDHMLNKHEVVRRLADWSSAR